jgi:5-methylcytosine-specific restriction endonuclease McrA
MSRALVLNATYEPLSVVSRRRAIVLVLASRADVVHDSGEVAHSEHLSVAVPSVIRLRSFVHVPFRRRASLSRRGVFARVGHRCQYCGGPAESIDHVVPRSRGGTHDWENVVACCRPCNTAKRDRLLEHTSMRLRRSPRPPRHSNWVAAHVGRVPNEWETYLRPAPVRRAPVRTALSA